MEKDAYVDKIKKRVPQAEEEVGELAIDSCLDSALRRYSSIRPQSLRYDYDGDGSTYDFDLPSDWVEGFSGISSVEFPSGEREPRYLKHEWWLLYKGTASTIFRLLTTPTSSETVRIGYWTPHTITATTDTVYAEDREAVTALASSFVCDIMKAKYAGHQEPTLAADIVNYRSKSREFGEASRSFRTEFAHHFSMTEKDIAPAAIGYAELEPQSVLDIDEIIHDE